jgi:cobalamin biosynthesis Mg chelatase CobN
MPLPGEVAPALLRAECDNQEMTPMSTMAILALLALVGIIVALWFIKRPPPGPPVS